jgi:hypothetical protein
VIFIAVHVHLIRCDGQWVGVSPIDGSALLVSQIDQATLVQGDHQQAMLRMVAVLYEQAEVVELVTFVQADVRVFSKNSVL